MKRTLAIILVVVIALSMLPGRNWVLQWIRGLKHSKTAGRVAGVKIANTYDMDGNKIVETAPLKTLNAGERETPVKKDLNKPNRALPRDPYTARQYQIKRD